jgi:pimeloyl-ACP methyl ester carboxylesterase
MYESQRCATSDKACAAAAAFDGSPLGAASLRHDAVELASCPIYVFVGEHDAFTPVDRMRKLQTRHPHAVTQVIPDCAHLLAVGPTNHRLSATPHRRTRCDA